MFSSLQHLEGVADPVPIIQGVLQTGQELRPLRDEIYCQLIKQTTRPPQPGSPGNLCNWKILACMSCTFMPTRSILRYLKLHLKRFRSPPSPSAPTQRRLVLQSDSDQLTLSSFSSSSSSSSCFLYSFSSLSSFYSSL